MTPSNSQSEWARLFGVACDLIRQVNAEQSIIDQWTFGGGTAMMLQIDHRQSRDVDIFLPDAQLLPFLDPKTHDFKFEIQPSDYAGDGSLFLKLAFEGISQIDFIVAATLTSDPTTSKTVEGIEVQLETVPEIIAKKIYYRGSSIKPRDIFDVAAAGRAQADQVIGELKPYRGQVTKALAAIEKLNPEFVDQAIAELSI